MRPSQRRLLALIGGLGAILLTYATLYMIGMERLEGEPRSFLRSLSWASETLTTTGYGKDAEWRHPLMVLLVISLQWIGVFIILMVFPIYVIPFLEERFEPRLPRRVPAMEGHIVIYHYGPAVETLLVEIEAARAPYVIVEHDPAVARALLDKGRKVVHATDEDEGLAAAHLSSARALIANDRDEANAGLILGARQGGFRGEIVALVEEPIYRQPMTLAGASAVYTPRHVLAAALAARASERINPRISGIQQLGKHLEVRELRILPASPLATRTLGELGLGARTGATVLGQWVGGRLQTPPHADMRLEPRGILVVAGSPESLERVGRLAEGATPLRREGPFLIAGFGEVGQKVHELLTDAGEVVRVVDRNERRGVDVVGSVLDPSVLERAGVAHARSVILALDSDDATLFATVIVQDVVPDAPIIARVNLAHNLEKIRRAGVDFALSISQVSGQILAQRLLGEEAVALDPHLRLLRLPVASMSGKNPVELRIRERTGCSVVAVERGEELIGDLPADFRFAPGDAMFVCGSDAAIRRLRESFPEVFA